MKEHITPKQAKQITEEQYYSLFEEIVPRENWANYHHKKMTVGKMIGLLAIDEIKIKKNDFVNMWSIETKNGVQEGVHLVDVLWKAIQQKINKK